MNTPDNNDPQDQPEEEHPDAVAQAESIVEDAIVRDTAAEVGGDDAGETADEQSDGDTPAESALAEAQAKATEHLADLQRLQAEFVNYRKRVDRDRANSGDQATAKVIEALIPALDDIAAAREHGDLTDGPFAAIADKLEEALGRVGWSRYGAPGEPFDPALHEALMSQPSDEVAEPTVTQVAQPGHRIGERVVRAARVVVSQPE
ncbi:MAG: nucleotide exchange factor GrpE [Demequina sp.]